VAARITDPAGSACDSGDGSRVALSPRPIKQEN
jgi:hypothetical protein